MRINSGLSCVILSLLLLAISGGSWAHKVIFDVYPSGAVIEGELGFSNGDMALEQLISVQDDSGLEIAQIYTDNEGFFVFTPAQKVAMTFVADLGAGHVAQANVTPEDMTSSGTFAAAASVTTEAPVNTQKTQVVTPANRKQASNVAEQLGKLSSELKHMRREIKSYKEKQNLQTILGGIGYIFGLVGLAYYLAARRKLQDQ
ncbi:MAG TPA: cobalt ABC transporter permease [Oceanospirillaceae bacterium]|nr:cobalt ABC transporter permease [Oceanospirillaceae bacterium]